MGKRVEGGRGKGKCKISDIEMSTGSPFAHIFLRAHIHSPERGREGGHPASPFKAERA